MMNRIKIGVCALGLVSAASLCAALPEVTNVTVGQPRGSGRTEISYTLVNGPAVVTMDIETNGPSGWASIGLENVYGTMKAVSGDANRVVSNATGRIRWSAHKTWAGRTIADGSIRAVLTAWPVDDKPDYMVVDLNDGPDSADRVRYYVSTNSLPGGGLFGNDAYRTTHLVLKKVVAKDIPWTMGSSGEGAPESILAREQSHPVTLAHNYYLGVFPLTQRQTDLLRGFAMNQSFKVQGEMRIRDCLYFLKNNPYVRGTGYPNAPTDTSILGLLRKKTANAVDFDLPSEAEWEYAAKAGRGEGYWGTKDIAQNLVSHATTGIYSYDANVPGRYLHNQADNWVRVDSGAHTLADWQANSAVLGPENGTPIAGSYPPNDWGFYDMAGSVWEWCNDFYQQDISAYGGAMNVSADGAKCLNGVAAENDMRVLRGGSWFSRAFDCRPSVRNYAKPTYPGDCIEAGCRVYCRDGLK